MHETCVAKEDRVSKTGKIVLGCVGAVVLLGTCAGGLVMYGGFKLFSWGKGQVGEMTEEVEKLQKAQQEIESLQRQASANAFTRPADGRLSEPRLLKFLAVRRDVHAVYEQHRALIESRGQTRQPSFSELAQLPKIVTEIRLAQARAQVREGLSDEEYGFLVGEVYKSVWARALTEGSDAPGSASTRLGQGLDEAEQALRKQLANPNLPPAARETLERQLESLKEAGREAQEQAKGLDVPPENIELLRRHEAEIKQYAMDGLALIGL